MARVTKDAAAAVEPEAGDGAPSGPVYRVTARTGRRRAGRVFGPAPTDIPASEISEEEIAALLGDPALVVEGPLTL